MNFKLASVKQMSTVLSLMVIVLLISPNIAIVLAPPESDVLTGDIFILGAANADSISIVSNHYQTRAQTGPDFSNVSYAIITPDDFAGSLIPLADWKMQKGEPSEIYNLSWIYSNYDGRDKAERIHNFLIDLNWKSPQLKWLLLVGDSELIPPRYVITNISDNAEGSNLDNLVATDYYYAGLGSNWDTDYDEVYGEEGEEDWTANVYVGRLPVNNLTEVNIAVDKILDYELSPPAGDWSKTGIFCSALMDTPNIIDDSETDVDEGYNWYKDNAYEATEEILKFLPLEYNITEFTDYPRKYGGSYSKLNDSLNYTGCKQRFNEGASIVSFISHGYETGDGVIHYSGNGDSKSFTGYFNHNDAYNAVNGDKLPFIYSSSCTSGNFTETDDSNLERLLTSPTGGAIGFIGATALTYRGEFNENDSSWGNWWLAKNFWMNFFNGYPKPGENLYNLKEAYNERIHSPSNPHKGKNYFKLYRTNLLAYNLLGDPELSIHTDKVGEMTATHPTDLEVVTRALELDFEVNAGANGEPLKNALICLQGNGIYETIETDKNGKATLDLHLHEPGEFNIVITAQNFYPYESSITIRNYIDLAINETDIYFDKSHPAAGDELVITAKVKNYGQSTASSVTVKFYDGYPGTNSSINNQLGANQTISVLGPNEAKNISMNWVMPEGAHAVYVTLDPDDLILESSENNNLAYGVIIENIPPKLSNLPDISIDEDTILLNALDLSIYTWDPDTPELEYTILENSNSKCDISINSFNYLDIIPEPDWSGTSTVMIRVYDGASAAVDSMTVQIAKVDDLPVLEVPENLTAVEDEQFKFKISATDIDSKALVFYDDTELFDIDHTSGVISFIPSNEYVGVHNITITVSDGTNNVSKTVLFTVHNVNDLPEFAMNTTVLKATEGKRFITQVTATDIDPGDTLTYSDDTDLFEIDPVTGEIIFTPSQNDVGEHTITISVWDGNETVTLELVLTIEEDRTSSGLEFLAIGVIVVVILIIIIFIVLKNQRGKNN